MAALDDIAAERRRQIEAEGWTTKHDDSHDNGELAAAAGSYALATSRHLLWVRGNLFPLTWPWKEGQWKPKSQRENLVRAAALIVAEIERLDRLAQ